MTMTSSVRTRVGHEAAPRPAHTGRRRRVGLIYLALLPAATLLVVFNWYPAFSALGNSFYHWNGGNIHQFVGLENYRNLFQDKTFLASVKNGAIFVGFRMVAQLLMPLIAAELVVRIRSSRLAQFWKVLFISPLVVPGVAMMLIWRFIYQSRVGILNRVLDAVGLDSLQHAWLSDPSTALGAISMVRFPWLATLQFLVLLGGLQSIPKEIHESAIVDGARSWSRMVFIEIPYIAPQIAIVCVLTAVNMVQQFTLFLVLTDGGPGTATLVPGLYLYHSAFRFLDFGYASTIGVIMFIFLLILAIISLRLGRQRTGD